MGILKPGDTISCRIREGEIVSSYYAYEFEANFQVIATDDDGCFIYVPDNIPLWGTIRIDKEMANRLNIRKQFIDSDTIHVSSARIVSIKERLDGCLCKRCLEYFPQAEPNQLDGTMLCFLCRTYPWR